MDFRDKKWQLMMRDPLCQDFDKVLHDHLLDPGNIVALYLRKKLEREVREKWRVSIYIPEVFTEFGRMFEKEPNSPRLKGLRREDFVGSFKWWQLAGEPLPIVEDVKYRPTIFIRDDSGVIDTYCSDNKDVVYCPPHKIPILIDPTTIAINDAKKVKKEVWEIVKKYLEDNSSSADSEKMKDKGWNPTLPPGEPQELAKIFRSKPNTFVKYLCWYDLKKKEGLTFTLIAIIEKSKTPEKQIETTKRILKSDKKPKIRTPVEGESTVRNGFNLIYKAIHRTNPPTREQDIQTQKKYDCPEHGGDCSSSCDYFEKWENKFNKEHKDISSKGTQEYIDTYKHSPTGKKKRPPKKDY